MTTVLKESTITCDITGETVKAKPGKSGPKLPSGWKRIDGKIYSRKAFKQHFRLAAVILPVASPVVTGEQSPEALREGWKQLRTRLGEAWSLSTNAANWAVKELLKNDITRDPAMGKCPPMPPIYLYGLGSWQGWASSAQCVLRTVEQKYRKRRYETIWLGEACLPNTRYPYPFPWHKKDWKVREEQGGQLIFDAPLPGGRVAMRLRTGRQHRRQIAGIRFLAKNPDLRGEAAVYKRDADILIKLVGYFPRKEQEQRDGTMFVRTDADSLLIGLNSEDERMWIINGDRAKNWIIRHQRNVQRHAEDRKYETRRPKRTGRQYQRDLTVLVARQHNRMDSYVKETAAAVVMHAKRRKLARIVYDDSGEKFLDQFPWFRLAERISQVCDREGIDFERSTAPSNPVTVRNGATTEEK